jgi:hypothetical protein
MYATKPELARGTQLNIFSSPETAQRRDARLWMAFALGPSITITLIGAQCSTAKGPPSILIL